jgi:septal ring factor EnvC (AmiA/AmiB activator)
MADPPSGDPGGDPTNSDRIMTLSQPQRSPSPPAFRRVTRAYKRQRNSLMAATGNNRAPSFDFSGNSKERGTNYDEVAWLIANLKKTIIDQNHTIKKVTAELTEIKSEKANLAAQNIDLWNEIRSLHNQLSTYLENPPSSRSWALVVANGNAISTETSLSKSLSNESLKKEPNCL